MSLRKRVLFAVLLLAMSCGRSSTAPAPTPTVGKLALTAGNYQMSVGLTSTGGSCFVFSSNQTVVGNTIQFQAVVTRVNNTFVLRPAGASDLGLMATVTTTSIGFTGDVAGKVRDTDKNVVATFSGSGALTGLDALSTSAIIGGTVTGSIEFADAASSMVCSSASFTLTPR